MAKAYPSGVGSESGDASGTCEDSGAAARGHVGLYLESKYFSTSKKSKYFGTCTAHKHLWMPCASVSRKASTLVLVHQVL
jgi:hypothetical protein